MGLIVVLAGLYWIGASIWIEFGGDPVLVFASILPAAWSASLSLLTD